MKYGKLGKCCRCSKPAVAMHHWIGTCIYTEPFCKECGEENDRNEADKARYYAARQARKTSVHFS